METPPYLEKRVSLISRTNIRYEGILEKIDYETKSLILSQVQPFGTENRPAPNGIEVPASSIVYSEITFSSSDIESLNVIDNQTPQTQSSEFNPMYPTNSFEQTHAYHGGHPSSFPSASHNPQTANPYSAIGVPQMHYHQQMQNQMHMLNPMSQMAYPQMQGFMQSQYYQMYLHYMHSLNAQMGYAMNPNDGFPQQNMGDSFSDIQHQFNHDFATSETSQVASKSSTFDSASVAPPSNSVETESTQPDTSSTESKPIDSVNPPTNEQSEHSSPDSTPQTTETKADSSTATDVETKSDEPASDSKTEEITASASVVVEKSEETVKDSPESKIEPSNCEIPSKSGAQTNAVVKTSMHVGAKNLFVSISTVEPHSSDEHVKQNIAVVETVSSAKPKEQFKKKKNSPLKSKSADETKKVSKELKPAKNVTSEAKSLSDSKSDSSLQKKAGSQNHPKNLTAQSQSQSQSSSKSSAQSHSRPNKKDTDIAGHVPLEEFDFVFSTSLFDKEKFIQEMKAGDAAPQRNRNTNTTTSTSTNTNNTNTSITETAYTKSSFFDNLSSTATPPSIRRPIRRSHRKADSEAFDPDESTHQSSDPQTSSSLSLPTRGRGVMRGRGRGNGRGYSTRYNAASFSDPDLIRSESSLQPQTHQENNTAQYLQEKLARRDYYNQRRPINDSHVHHNYPSRPRFTAKGQRTQPDQADYKGGAAAFGSKSFNPFRGGDRHFTD